MKPEKVICTCKNVTKGDILKAMESGATTYQAVKAATGAGSKCGECKADVKRFIKKQLAENQADKT